MQRIEMHLCVRLHDRESLSNLILWTVALLDHFLAVFWMLNRNSETSISVPIESDAPFDDSPAFQMEIS